MMIPIYALPHRVTIIPFKGSGAYGPVYETDPAKFKKNVPCRIDPKRQKVTSSNGDDVVQSAEAIFRPNIRLNVGDKVLWTKYGLEYEIEDWAPIDAMGPHSIEAVLR